MIRPARRKVLQIFEGLCGEPTFRDTIRRPGNLIREYGIKGIDFLECGHWRLKLPGTSIWRQCYACPPEERPDETVDREL